MPDHPHISSLPPGSTCPYANVIPSATLANYYYQWCVLATIGLLYVVHKAAKLLSAVYYHFLRPSADLSKFGAKKGGWAIVTGCTDGIGRGFAEVLCERGFNLVLLSRNQEKLQDLSRALEKINNKVQTKVLPVNCSDVSPANFERIRQGIEGLDVSILVNNVGVNLEIPTALEDNTDEMLDNMINVNIIFTTKLTRLVIPILKRRPGGSIVLNLTSLASRVPLPLLTVYSASKAYTENFSSSLVAEFAPSRIRSVAILPGYVMSSMTRIKKPSFFCSYSS
jgi:17beta-estradiol 17-dehydrogenase / very-long-chain 3-oxoacyl-CoA reductase